MPRFILPTRFNNPALPSRPVPGFLDEFARADNELTLGKTVDGKEWEILSPNSSKPIFGIANGMARLVSVDGTSPEALAIVEANASMGSLYTTIGAIGEAGSGIVVCAYDAKNYVRISFRNNASNTTLNISGRVGGTATESYINGPSCATGDVIEARVGLGVVDVYKNGVLALANYAIPNSLIGATKHGIWGNTNSLNVRWARVEFKA